MLIFMSISFSNELFSAKPGSAKPFSAKPGSRSAFMHSALAMLSGRRVISSKSLYRRLGSSVIVLFALWGSVAVQSQRQAERPQIVPQKNKPPENKKPKNGKEPRALGVLQLSSGGKGTLVPVAILIDGRFYDASAYKADPVPMALESGTAEGAEEAGESKRLLT